MHSLIDINTVETIRTTGNTNSDLPDRTEILKTHNLPIDQPSQEVIITGCQIIGLIPRVLRKFADILDQKEISYTFLSK